MLVSHESRVRQHAVFPFGMKAGLLLLQGIRRICSLHHQLSSRLSDHMAQETLLQMHPVNPYG